ncbi:HAD-IA family hydrolase [Paenibacillus melissococcoides]|uniref:HAD-IA family hydrolase n=1 Tax=Paenibacillus melissococcoides TaxID=2912268 RepID=A0ABM9GBY7_9BACL|nr:MULTISPECIES: HAD-IA family hydrolase [Paenibacillus]MEB9892825.1 HAD-IA family hydrolase [Bacillus cereus]CAH8248954.1 HAD-IA family hydrolase [Paenibacillus melissococcoides]CAH8720773.1 HAD-IA family hydrolase [Paenibacillus melissococcoides]CAH8720888.1 HAD-IA family hydrolase [Paenibacillus melissococcoides]GIO80553.1 hypothetical protein J6TS7_41630 [Paenibacillus dendritiformis]
MKDLLQYIQEQKKKIVLFDIFDTILLRSVEPEYTKKIWAKRFSIQLGDHIPYDRLYMIRNEIEMEICQINADNGDDQEFHFDDFIKVLYQKLLDNNLITSNYEYSTFARECKETELEVEKAVQFVDKEWIEVVSELKRKGIRVVCVSDFYLSKSMLRDLFDYHNISSYVDDIFVSSEFKRTKRTGRLFDVVINELKLVKTDIIMVGDNKHSDFNMPKHKGIDAYLLDREEQRHFYEKFKRTYENDISYFQGIRSIAESMRKTQKQCFHEITFSLYLYIELLHKQLIMQKAKNVFFLAREGEFLLKLFNEYQKKQGYIDIQHIRPHYIKVSRKSTFLPSLKKIDEEKFDILFRQYRNISIRDFLASINFDQEEIERITLRLNIDSDHKERDLPTSEAFNMLLCDSEFRNVYEDKRSKQKDLFLKYLMQYGVKFENEGVHLVDVGWKGTIQDNIYRILGEKVLVAGYYLGLISTGDMKDNNKKQGILFSSIPYKSPFYDVHNENRALYEVILGASHGSANQYIEKNGVVDVETIQTDKEKQLFEQIISPLQDDIYQYFCKLCELFCKKSIKVEKFASDFAKIHARMVFFPTNKEINFFNGLYHYENFGVFEYSTFKIQNKFNLGRTLRNSLAMLRNPRAILNKGFWAPITLKNEGLGYLVKLYGWYKYNRSFSKKYQSHKDAMTSRNSSIQVEQLNQLKVTIQEQKDAIQKMTRMIDDRDEAIKSMTKMIDDRDEAIKSMTKMIDDRDEVIRQLSLQLESNKNK